MQPQDGGVATVAALNTIFTALFIVGGLITIICMAVSWRIYTKAGQPGWASLIPFYNLYVLLKIIEKPAWWMILFFLPCIGFVMGILVAVALAEKFGKGILFAAGLILLPFIFLAILAFGDAEYQGSTASA